MSPLPPPPPATVGRCAAVPLPDGPDVHQRRPSHFRFAVALGQRLQRAIGMSRIRGSWPALCTVPAQRLSDDKVAARHPSPKRWFP